MTCASKLLANDDVSYIFLTTDNEATRTMSYSVYARLAGSAKSKSFPEIVEWKYKTVSRDASSNILNLQAMDASSATAASSYDNITENAMMEWLLVGEADYCMLAEQDTSTFSSTAVLRGRCRLIAATKDLSECRIPVVPADKEASINLSLFSVAQKDSLRTSPLDSTKRNRILESMNVQSKLVDVQCFEEYVYQHDSPIREYWSQIDL